MTKELVHLANGEDVLTRVDGKSPDGQRGHVLLAVDLGSIQHTLAESIEVEVEKRPDGSWQEVKK